MPYQETINIKQIYKKNTIEPTPITYQLLKQDYQTLNTYCKNIGKVYDYRQDKLHDLLCNKWNCSRCRKIKKNKLYHQIVKAVLIHNINIHFVITFKGKDYRQQFTPIESYEWMNKLWDLFLHKIKYDYYEHHTLNSYAKYYGEQLTYIILPRAQKTGYCHFHIFLKDTIDFDYLDSVRHQYGLGYTTILHNQSLADYLHKDFFNDHEWIIPYNIKHYRTSRNILLNNESTTNFNQELIVFPHNNINIIEQEINNLFARPLPHEEYVKQMVNQ